MRMWRLLFLSLTKELQYSQLLLLSFKVACYLFSLASFNPGAESWRHLTIIFITISEFALLKVALGKVCYLQIQMDDVHFVHIAQSLTDLSDEHDRVQLSQRVVLIDNPVEELTAIHAVINQHSRSC